MNVHATDEHPRFQEPLARTLTRNVGIALVAGGLFALTQRNPALVLPSALLALWYSLGGHYVEVAFLNTIRQRIATGRCARSALRIAVWFAGGVVLYLLMATTARLLPVPPLRFELWWLGGFILIGVELVVHALLRLRGLPNFYRGDG